MILTNEDYNGLLQVLTIVNTIIRNAVMSEQEEQRERDFIKLNSLIGNNFVVRENISKEALIKEIKEMLLQLNIKGSPRIRKNGLIEFRSSLFGSVYGHTKEELERNILDKLKQQKSGKTKSAILFSEFFNDTYLPYKRETIKESSIGGVLSNFKFIVESDFDKPLNRYTAEAIEKFLLSIPQTRKRKKIRGLFNNVFKYAKQLGKIKNNPCDNVTQVKHVSVKGRALSFLHQEIFFDNIFRSEKIKLVQKLYLVYVYLTGSRRAEALNVLASDFDLQCNALHLPGTKTNGSDRLIPLFPLVKKLYDCMQQVRNIESGTFFGLKVSQVDKIMKHGGFNDDYHLHDLRHTFGTIEVCVQKLDPKTVSLHMGHTDISMTLNTYTHPEQLDKALFFDGSTPDEEKVLIMKLKYQAILSKISAFLDEHTQIVPKN